MSWNNITVIDYKCIRARANIEHDLIRFGDRITNGLIILLCAADDSQCIFAEIRDVCRDATPPSVTQYDHWGQRIDRLNTCEAWRKLKAIAQEEGLIAIHFERQNEEFSRIHGFVKQVMMIGDAQVVSHEPCIRAEFQPFTRMYQPDFLPNKYDRRCCKR